VSFAGVYSLMQYFLSSQRRLSIATLLTHLPLLLMTDSIQHLIEPHVQDLGGFQARRLLPSEVLTLVGPFIFFDHLGPAIFPAGQGVDVRPHPHINLATVTYLFEGVLLHRDSVGSVQEIHPGAVNWMTAGRGIVHSERSPDDARNSEAILHGIQTWVALPNEHEETEPWFRHHPATDLPTWEENEVSFTLIAGEAYGRRSPVQTFSPMIYLDIQLAPGAQFVLPGNYSEQAVYSVTPGLRINEVPLEQHRLAMLATGTSVTISAEHNSEGTTAERPVRCVIVGGEPVGERHKWWNFVSSRPERIKQAKQDWREGRFGQVPGETEFIPLPEEPKDKEQPM
jgi:redox-sensitive bicupin YhaK (pirin superfamily)